MFKKMVNTPGRGGCMFVAAKLKTNVNTLEHRITILFIKTDCINNIQLIFKVIDNGFNRQGNYNDEPLL